MFEFSRLRQTMFAVFQAWSEFPTFPPKRREFCSQITHSIIAKMSQCHGDSIWCSTPKFASILRIRVCDDNSACVPSKFLKGKYFLVCGAPWRRVTIASDECPYTFT